VSPAKILLVDDEPSIHTVVTAYLKAEGFEYQSAMDGPGGLAAARTFKPDIIVLDVMLPGMDGIELARPFAPRVERVRHPADRPLRGDRQDRRPLRRRG